LDAAAFAGYKAGIELAEQHFRRGQFESALDRFQALLRGRLDGALAAGSALENDADVVVVDRAAHLASLFGMHDAADSLLEGIAVAARGADNSYLAVYASLKRLHLALAHGRLQDAQNQLLALSWMLGDIRDIDFSAAGLDAWEALHHWPGIDPPGRKVLLASFYLAAGRLLSALGQYGDALGALERGRIHCGAGSPDLARRTLPALILASAAAALEAGRLDQARKTLASAEGIDRVRNPGYRVEWLECLGKLHLLAGEYGAALQCFEEVLALARAGRFRHALVVGAINLAHIRILLNQTAAAAEVLAVALAQAQALRDHAAELRARMLLGLARRRGKSLAEGVAIAPSVSEMWGVPVEPGGDDTPAEQDPAALPQPSGYLAFFEDRALGVQWRLGHRDADAAAAQLARLDPVFAATDSGLVRLRMRVLHGMVAYYRGDWAGAEAHLEWARGEARAMALRPELWQITRVLAWSKIRLGRGSDEVKALSREADSLLESLTQSLQGAERAFFLVNKWTAEEEALAAEIDELVAQRAQYLAARWYRKPLAYWALLQRVHRLMWRLDRHKTLLAKRVLSGAGEKDGAGAAPSLAQRLLGSARQRATLVFHVLPDRMLVICAHGLRLDFGVSPVTRLQARNLVRRWHAAAARGEQSAAAELRRVAKQLGAALQIPGMLDRLGKRIGALRIVPDDVLHGCPFAALEYRGRYVVERFALSMGFESMPGASRDAAQPGATALLFGVSAGNRDFPPLPGVRDELLRIAPVLAAQRWRATQIGDESAAKGELLSLLPGASLLHIACHGTFEPDRPEQSGLVLIAPGGKAETLSLRELSNLDLRHLRHATLSSCWSADNFVLPGRWIIGLPETLCRAGAGSVLASLWPVPDQLTVAFAERFYRHLAAHPRERALQLAQIDCLRGSLEKPAGEDLPDVPYWAGFCLYGDPGSLGARGP